jgi:hypothetical protein
VEFHRLAAHPYFAADNTREIDRHRERGLLEAAAGHEAKVLLVYRGCDDDFTPDIAHDPA